MCYITSFLLLHVLKVLFQHERKRWTLTRLANSMFNKRRRRAAHSLLMRHFSCSTYDLKINAISVKCATDF